jgi:hypothetical protein
MSTKKSSPSRRTFKSHWRGFSLGENGETNDSPSWTVPNMEIDLKKSVEAFKHGEVIQRYVPQYSEDLPIEVPEWSKLTVFERLEWAAENREEIIRLQQEYIADQQNTLPSNPPSDANTDDGPKEDS